MNSKTKVLGTSHSNVKSNTDIKSSTRVQPQRHMSDQHEPEEQPWSNTYVPDLPQYPHLQMLIDSEMLTGAINVAPCFQFPELAAVQEEDPPSPPPRCPLEAPAEWQHIEPVDDRKPLSMVAVAEPYIELTLLLSSESESE